MRDRGRREGPRGGQAATRDYRAWAVSVLLVAGMLLAAFGGFYFVSQLLGASTSSAPPEIDSLADVYRDEFMQRYFDTYYVTPDWRTTLERYAVEYVLIEEGGPLHTLLVASKEWRELYRDEVAVLLKRGGVVP